MRSHPNTSQKAGRRHVRRALVLAAVVATAACGSDDGAGSTTTAPAATTTGADPTSPVDTSSADFPVTLEQMTGEVTIEAKPQRVATLGYTDTDIANALGANIVIAVASPFGDDGVNAPWAATPLTADVATLNPIEPDFEAIAAADPDVILATAAYPSVLESYEQLSSIAPVVSPITGPLLDSADDLTRVIGAALGETAAAEALLVDADTAIDAYRAQHPELVGRTVVFAPREGEQTAIFIDDSAASVALLERLGLTVPAEVQQLPGTRIFGATFISDEQLDLLDTADIAIVGLYSDAARTDFLALPTVAALDVTTAGNLIPIDRTLGAALQSPNPLSIHYVLTELGPALAATTG